MKKIFTIIGLILISLSVNAQIVIGEVYRGSGNSESIVKNDYILLKNIGAFSASLSGATIQYAPEGGNFTQYHILPTLTLGPGQSYLIKEAVSNEDDVDFPAADFAPTDVINFNGTLNPSKGIVLAASGKIALVGNTTMVTGPTGDHILDFVGYGPMANQFEGSGPAPSLNGTVAIKRIAEDNNDNKTDFVVSTVQPVNSLGNMQAVVDTQNMGSGFVENAFIKNNIINFVTEVKDVKVFDKYGQVVKKSTKNAVSTLDVTGVRKGDYIVTGTINNEPVSQRIVKD